MAKRSDWATERVEWPKLMYGVVILDPGYAGGFLLLWLQDTCHISSFSSLLGFLAAKRI